MLPFQCVVFVVLFVDLVSTEPRHRIMSKRKSYFNIDIDTVRHFRQIATSPDAPMLRLATKCVWAPFFG